MTPDWIKAAKVGDRVVCVDATTSGRELGGRGSHWEDGSAPKVGSVYTIAGIGVSHGGMVVFDFVELKRSYPFPEYGYGAIRFRPVQPRKTDISWAHDILKKASKPVEEHA